MNPQAHGVPDWGWAMLDGASWLGLLFATFVAAAAIAMIALLRRKTR